MNCMHASVGVIFDSGVVLGCQNEDKSAGQNLVKYFNIYNAWY